MSSRIKFILAPYAFALFLAFASIASELSTPLSTRSFLRLFSKSRLFAVEQPRSHTFADFGKILASNFAFKFELTS